MLKQNLKQKQLQKLSPQQIQLMKLLQVPTATLDQRIQEEMETNPALEEGQDEIERKDDDINTETEETEEKEESEDELYEPDIDLSEYFDDDEPSYKTRSNNYSSDEEHKSIPIPVVATFQEHLGKQLGMLDLDDRETIIAEQIVGSIDDDGYLRRELIAISDDLAFAQNLTVEEEEIAEILTKVQEFDPAGVGARDLRECLLLQLERDQNPEDEYVQLAVLILDKYFDAFAKKHYRKLVESLEISEDQLKEALEEILKLNPKPGSAYTTPVKAQKYIVPDFTIRNEEGELILTLNSRNAPELRVSDSFREMLTSYNRSETKSKKEKETILFIKRKIDSAKWFIDAIKQRQETMIKTMNAILEHQYKFFSTGDETKMKPMILKDIALKTNLDISTVSRVANSKYVQTEFGTFLLKYFFSESLSTDSGEEVSTREVKKILSEIIEGENKRKPFSDQKLTEKLKEKGYNIARRTVAKYRELLNIPVARLRKEL
ncbi:MAG: RNA polymerase factor sigma-54 [Chitinophagales bacterium]|nr:RNA polymerase factor sigma-54 [Chitinophagales bacterium]